MKTSKLLYEGKAKKIFATDDENLVVQIFKDDATAFNGEKKGQILGKGKVNNSFSSIMFELLEKKGVPTHFVKKIDDNSMLIKKVDIFKLEVIIRNVAAGSFTKKYGVEEGTKFETPTFETSYKNDEFGDPLLNDYHAVAMNLATWEEIDVLKKYAFKINSLMKEILDAVGIKLVDFKLEFGKTSSGEIVLADEISPDTCRFWDKKTGEKLDKDRFRRGLGNVEEAYSEMLKRIKN